MSDPRYPPIEDHAVIGDLHTVALVALDGTIDFMCVPEFDSPTVFASLLDRERGGYYRIAPVMDEVRHRQLYLPDTNVLMTRFMSPDGVAEVSDFMPVGGARDRHRVIRRAKSVRGEITFRMRCEPRFDYGRAGHRVRVDTGGICFQPEGNGIAMHLQASVPVRAEDGAAVAEFTLRAGESATFVLEEGPSEGDPPPATAQYASTAFKETVNYWRRWIGGSTYRGRWRDEVHRSALLLKLLTSQRHGSLIAAPTFGLPEGVGGTRNWDYRYTWIRDAAFTLYALIRLGMTEETGSFMKWIADRCGELGPDGPLQPLYRIDGGHEIPETELDHLRGYRDSRPVRIGNAAAGQLQLDLYGALLDAVYLHDKYADPISYDMWGTVTMLVNWVCDNWRRPDEGIWEVRSGQREFLHSRLLCWVAVDRAIRLSRKRGLPAPEAEWLAARDAMYRSVFDDFWDPQRGAFVQSRGRPELDAAAMLMPLLRFMSPTDPRWLSALRAIEAELVEDSLVRRYRVVGPEMDGIEEEEGTFTICSFWYAECLSRAGDVQQARLVFDKVLAYANHVGLFAEQLGPSGEHLGNFPQAFTHLALISAAYDLDRRLTDAGWEA